MTGAGMEMEATALSAVAAELDAVAARAKDRSRRLELVPDAGRSTDETAGAVAALADVVGGLAEHFEAMAGTLRAAVQDYSAADERSAVGLPSLR